MKAAILCVAAFASAIQVTRAVDLHPLIEVQSEYLIGGRAGRKWLDSQKAAPLVKPGETFRLFSFNGEVGRAKGGKPASVEEPCPDTHSIKLSTKPENAIIGIAAPWNPMPRKPRDAAKTQPVYVQAVREFLGTRGLANAEVKITRIVRVDLDGDGEEEVLISATNYGGDTGTPGPNTDARGYSFVLLRRVVAGKVQTQLLEGEFYPKAKNFNAPNAYEILAVLDADGDGELEVIVESNYYEGGAVTVFSFDGGKPKDVLTVACGA